jgi:hypothetical protein
MKLHIVDISDSAFLDAAFPPETPEDAEFRRVFGRDPEPCDRELGLTSVVSVAQALDRIVLDELDEVQS